jgi:hypothetical protein
VGKSAPRTDEPKQSDTRRDLMRLLARADKGDRQALAVLRASFHEDPALWDAVGDAAFQAEAAMIELAAGSNEVVQEAIRRKMRRLRRELAGEAAPPLERLLVDRIAVCWLMLAQAESRYAQAMKAPSVSFELSEYHQRRCDRAQRRYLQAIKALAQVRRLLVPMMQVNIAERQVNVAQAAASIGGDG